MKTAKNLRLLIDIFFAFLIIALAGYIIAPMILFAKHKDGMEASLQVANNMGLSNSTLIIIALLGLVISILFIIGILNLRKTMRFMINGDYFSEKVTKNFKSAGTLFIIVGTVTFLVPLFILLVMSYSELPLNVSFTPENNSMPTNSPLFTIIIGLFFVLISHIFTNARVLKQENDLTI